MLHGLFLLLPLVLLSDTSTVFLFWHSLVLDWKNQILENDKVAHYSQGCLVDFQLVISVGGQYTPDIVACINAWGRIPNCNQFNFGSSNLFCSLFSREYISNIYLDFGAAENPVALAAGSGLSYLRLRVVYVLGVYVHTQQIWVSLRLITYIQLLFNVIWTWKKQENEKKTVISNVLLLMKREKYEDEITTTHSNAPYSSLTKPIWINPFVNH